MRTQLSEQRKSAFLEDLKTLLRIPSVSTDPAYKPDIARGAAEVARQMKQAGLANVEVFETDGHPIVYGDHIADPSLTTVLVYGHYDVQPEDPIELWQSPPFEPTIRDGKIFARGATDDKGQFLCHLKAVEVLLADHGALPVNLKILVEGEEEVGSTSLGPFLARHKERLGADVLVISDTAMYAQDHPSLIYGLRGLTYHQIDLRGAASDLHSGYFGGAVPNPADALTKILGSLRDQDGKVTVPGFYDKVVDMTPLEREAYAKLGFDGQELARSLGANRLSPESGYDGLESRTARPTVEINGLLSGYTGEGAKTVLPARAMAKVSCRLVPDQDPEEISRLLEEHIRTLCPDSVTCQVTHLQASRPWITSLHHPALIAASKAVRKQYGKDPVFVREGGSIPILHHFQEILGLPAVLLGLGLSDENLHAPNEHFRVENFYAGIDLVIELYRCLAELKDSADG
jgi:acetylornithine deacetylase/succinyl-diaminopimelate desuccinylase-like protein